MAERRDMHGQRQGTERDLAPTDRGDRAFAYPESAVPAEPVWHQPAPLGQAAPPSVPTSPVGQFNAMGQATNVNVTTNVSGPTMVFTHQKSGPGFFIRALWYVFIGWWASALAILVAYAALFTFVGIPLAFFIFNRLPTILTLRPRTTRWSARTEGDVTYVDLGNEPQRPWWQRTIYFLLVGWWFGAFWLVFAWAISIFIITLPLTFWMFNRASGVMTLHRH